MATRMLPRSTVVVRQAPSSAVAVRDFQYHAASTASAITTTATSRRRVGREEVRLLRGVFMRSGRGRGCRSESTRRGMMRRSEEHTSELQSLMRMSYAVFCLTKKNYRLYNHARIH